MSENGGQQVRNRENAEQTGRLIAIGDIHGYPPVTKVDREGDYRRALEEFSRRYASVVSSDQVPISIKKGAN